jgi:hypothetical protein
MSKKNEVCPYPGGIFLRSAQKLIRSLKKILGKEFKDNKYLSISPKNNDDLKEVVIDNFHKPRVNLQQIFSGVERFDCLDIYVHGSWADDTKTAFSDLDDLVIVDSDALIDTKEARKIEKWLNAVDMRFCRKDHLQHHGHWIINKNELNNYDESYMPLNVIDGSVCIKGSKSIQAFVNLSKTKSGTEKNIYNTLENIKKLNDKYQQGSINSYEMKCLVGSFLLVPAFIFQLKGLRLTKKEAIESKKKIFSEEVCSLIDKCSEIRRDWHLANQGYRFFIIKLLSNIFINPHLFRIFTKRYSPKFPKHEFSKIERFEVESFIFESQGYL